MGKVSPLKGRRFTELRLRSSVNCSNHMYVQPCFFDGDSCDYVWVRHRKGGRLVCSHPWIGNCEKFCPRYAKWLEGMREEDERVMAEIDVERVLFMRFSS